LITIIIFAFGLAVGSFLNVCIHRLPKDESIVNPPSHCPKCKKEIAWYDNIPLISYLALRGKCRHCGKKISPRYLIVESLTALIFVLLFREFGLSGHLLVFMVFSAVLIIATFIDFEHFIIPDVLTLGGLGLGLVLSLVYPSPFLEASSRWGAFLNSFLSASLGFVSLLVVGLLGTWMFKKEAMGGGDLKLLAMIGAFLGWKLVFLTIFLSSLVGSLVGLTLLLLNLKKRLEYIPYGPYLALGALVALFVGEEIIKAYLSLYL